MKQWKRCSGHNRNALHQKFRLAEGPELRNHWNRQGHSILQRWRRHLNLTFTPHRMLSLSGQMTIHIQTTETPESLTQAVIREIAAVDSKVAPYNTMSFSRLRKGQLFPLRALTTVSLLIGILTLVLTSIGIYGVLSYAVTQRTKEIGVRMALGASRKRILQSILSQGMTYVLTGTAAGLIASAFITKFLSSILFQISPTDKTSFMIVTILLTIVAIFACWIPARRAMKIEPTIALRYE